MGRRTETVLIYLFLVSVVHENKELRLTGKATIVQNLSEVFRGRPRSEATSQHYMSAGCSIETKAIAGR